MSKTFTPRNAGPGAWKTWHRDSVRTMARVGPFNTGILCVIVTAISIGAAYLHTSISPLLFFVVAPLMPCLGVLFMIFCQNLVSPAAEGGKASLVEAAFMTWMEVQANPGWVLRRFRGQLLVTVFFILVFVAFIAIVLSTGNPAAAEKSSSPSILISASTMALFFSVFPVFLQLRGPSSFSYWLGFKHGMSLDLSHHHQDQAHEKNPLSLSFSSLSFFFIYAVLGSIVPLSLILYPVFTLYHAAYTRCAYHDIFEDGTGLKEKKKVEEESSGMVPVLQA